MEKATDREKKNKGCFLTFEGPEGSGKTTQVGLLAGLFRESGQTVVCTREPGGTSFGDSVRSLLLDHADEHLDAETELFLMLAQRNEHLRRVIYPALNRGEMVICDRYLDSSLAYQGFGRGLNPDFILSMHKNMLGNCLPDVTVLFDLDPAAGLERARHGGRKKLDRMENEALEFHRRVRSGYLELAKQDPKRFMVIDASRNPEEIFETLKDQLKKRVSEIVRC